MSLLVRTQGNPLDQAPTIRARIWALDPSVPLDKTYLLEDKVAEATTSPRFTMLLVGLFAVLGLALAAIGIYGVMSYAVTERTREIGIRRALGADEAGIVRMILRQGVKLAAMGMASGIIMAVWTAGLFRALLFRVSATDPLTLAGVASLLMGVALVACYIPARRATRIDPLVALRYE
jgi:putative ABC transport system permease protein